MFPITPSDLRDRDLALRSTGCGYQFAAHKQNAQRREKNAATMEVAEL
jgi:hypothetical protein